MAYRVARLGRKRFRAPVSWEYFGNQTHQIPKTEDYAEDERCQLSCPNVTGGYWLDRLDPIPKPCVAGSSPAGGAEYLKILTLLSYGLSVYLVDGDGI